jgi:biotin transport system permease protein
MHSLYSDQTTWLHRVPAGAKLLVLSVVGVAQLFVDSPAVLLIGTLLCGALWASLGQAAWGGRRLLVSVLVAVLLIGAFHAAMGQPMVGVVSGLRLLSASLLGVMLTLTTSTNALLAVLEAIFSPLKPLGVRVDRWALQLAMMLRFTEHFFVVWRRLDDAHRVRTGRPGGLRLLAPLTIQMLLAARRVADTLELRLGE